MIPELEELYNRSLSRPDITRWIVDEEMQKEYDKNLRRSCLDCDRLEEILTGKELELFERYVKNQMFCLGLDQQMFFSEGFSAGLRLGILCMK